MADLPKRVLVLGATGHAGQAIVRHALEHGREVTALTRRADPESLRGLGVRVGRIESDLQSLTELAAGHDLLVDAAATYLLDVGVPGNPLWQSHVDAAVRRTERVVEAARRNGIPLAFVSSYGTIPRHDAAHAGDGAVWRRLVCNYYEAKIAMERIVIGAARGGLAAVIVNPVTFVGPWLFRDTWNFVSLVLAGYYPVVLDHIVNLIDVRDLAAAIDLAISREYFGRPIPLAGHDIHPSELVCRITSLAGRPPVRPFVMPGSLAATAAYWSHFWISTFGLTPPPFLELLTIVPELRPLRPSAEQIALGVSIRPLETSLRDAVAFHQRRRSA